MTPPIQTRSVIAASELLAAVGVGDRQQEEANGRRDENQVDHVLPPMRAAAQLRDGGARVGMQRRR